MKKVKSIIIALLIIVLLPVQVFASTNGDTTVYKTISGTSYHRCGCYHLTKNTIAISLEDAVNAGLNPCNDCNPPSLIENETDGVVSNNQNNNSDCVYITKSGTRYHKAGCQHIKGKSAIKVNISDAIKCGYLPCSDCKPQAQNYNTAASGNTVSKTTNNNSLKNNSNSSSSSSSTVSTSNSTSNSTSSSIDTTKAKNRNIVVVMDDCQECYHRKNCPNANNSLTCTLGKAIGLGLKWCSTCKPATLGIPYYKDTYDYYEYAGLTDTDDGLSNISKSVENYQEDTEENNTADTQTGNGRSEAIGAIAFTGCVTVLAVSYFKECKNKHENGNGDKEKTCLESDRDQFIKLLNGRSIREVAGVPDNIKFTGNGLPYDNNNQTYGSYTVYISKNGKHYHKKCGCHSASTPIHIFTVKDKYSPCNTCCKSNSIVIPKWFTDYQELKEKCKLYGISEDSK